MDNLKNILVIGTGGTIAGKGSKGVTRDYKSAQVDIKEIINDIPYINKIANVNVNDFMKIDSCDITMENLKDLSNYVSIASKEENVDGIVITHGTDTLEETAYFLNLTVKTKKPVVLTGSMRPSTAISADGPLNLYQAISLASSVDAKGKGVLISFSDAIYGARDVSKINTYRTQAFNQKDFGCLGYMQYDKPFFYSVTTKKHTINTEFDLLGVSKLPKVEIFYFYTDADTTILDYIVNRSDGVIIAGAGCSGVSETISKNIEKLLEEGFPIVRSSRIGNGLVTFSEKDIKTKGIYANNLNPQKSKILLSLGLTITKDLNKLQDIFNSY